MARTADHPARRQQMTDALLGVAAEGGLRGVTVARVADRAGVSVGLVQHYFGSKDELLRAAYSAVLTRIDERIRCVVDDGEASQQSIRTMAVRALEHMLPLDPDRRGECALRVEFIALAIHDPELAATAAAADRQYLTRLEQVIDNGRACGEVAPTTQTTTAAQDLLTVVNGVVLRGVTAGAVSSEPVTCAVDRIFVGECTRHR